MPSTALRDIDTQLHTLADRRAHLSRAVLDLLGQIDACTRDLDALLAMRIAEVQRALTP